MVRSERARGFRCGQGDRRSSGRTDRAARRHGRRKWRRRDRRDGAAERGSRHAGSGAAARRARGERRVGGAARSACAAGSRGDACARARRVDVADGRMERFERRGAAGDHALASRVVRFWLLCARSFVRAGDQAPLRSTAPDDRGLADVAGRAGGPLLGWRSGAPTLRTRRSRYLFPRGGDAGGDGASGAIDGRAGAIAARSGRVGGSAAGRCLHGCDDAKLGVASRDIWTSGVRHAAGRARGAGDVLRTGGVCAGGARRAGARAAARGKRRRGLGDRTNASASGTRVSLPVVEERRGRASRGAARGRVGTSSGGAVRRSTSFACGSRRAPGCREPAASSSGSPRTRPAR